MVFSRTRVLPPPPSRRVFSEADSAFDYVPCLQWVEAGEATLSAMPRPPNSAPPPGMLL